MQWSWEKDVKGGNKLNPTQKSIVKQAAIKNEYISNVKVTKVKGCEILVC